MAILGATNKFPRGKAHPSDEGELNLAVGIDPDHGIVVVNFGTPVVWLGIEPKQAREIAALLMRSAQALEAELPPIAAPVKDKGGN